MEAYFLVSVTSALEGLAPLNPLGIHAMTALDLAVLSRDIKPTRVVDISGPLNLEFKRSSRDQTSNTQDDLNPREVDDHEDG